MTQEATDALSSILGLDLDGLDDIERADFIDAARRNRVTGAYARRAIRSGDPELAVALAADLARADLDLMRALTAPESVRPPDDLGIDWDALGLASRPGFLAPDDPVAFALRDLEPAKPRAWRELAERRGGQQLPPAGDWLFWLIMAGRGFGKTWTGSNVLAEWAVKEPGDYALVAPTFGDARKICVEGKESGLLLALGDDLVEYNKSDYIVHARGGARIILGSADAPARLRGYNFRGAWIDELASFVNLKELWDEILLPALRIGEFPRSVITTTPKRGNYLLKELLDRADAGDPTVVLTRGRTLDNAANLSSAFMTNIYGRLAGTAAGRQELDGELLEDVEGALVSMPLVEATRIRRAKLVPELRRIVVGVDPAATNSETSDQCGIVVMGIGGPPVGATPRHAGEHLYVLENASLHASPESWARRVLEVAASWGADAIVAERNNGGDMVETMIRMVARAERLPMPRYYGAWASRGKLTRAEPVSGVWQQHRLHIVGAMPLLEDRWTSWVPGRGPSPDELDASVWAACGLMPELSRGGSDEVRIIA